jgi:hypothetical protein
LPKNKKAQKRSVENLWRRAAEAGMDLVKKLLLFHPEKRITAVTRTWPTCTGKTSLPDSESTLEEHNLTTQQLKDTHVYTQASCTEKSPLPQ